MGLGLAIQSKSDFRRMSNNSSLTAAYKGPIPGQKGRVLSPGDSFKYSSEAVSQQIAALFQPNGPMYELHNSLAADFHKAENNKNKTYYNLNDFLDSTRNLKVENNLKDYQINHFRKQRKLVSGINEVILGPGSFSDLQEDKLKLGDEAYEQDLLNKQIAAADRLGALVKNEAKHVSNVQETVFEEGLELSPRPVVAENILEALNRAVKNDSKFGDTNIFVKDESGQIIANKAGDAYEKKPLSEVLKKYDLAGLEVGSEKYNTIVSKFSKEYLSDPDISMTLLVSKALTKTSESLKGTAKKLSETVRERTKVDRESLLGSKERDKFGASLFYAAAPFATYYGGGALLAATAPAWAAPVAIGATIFAALYFVPEIYEACTSDNPDGWAKWFAEDSGNIFNKIGNFLSAPFGG